MLSKSFGKDGKNVTTECPVIPRQDATIGTTSTKCICGGSITVPRKLYLSKKCLTGSTAVEGTDTNADITASAWSGTGTGTPLGLRESIDAVVMHIFEKNACVTVYICSF